LKNLIIFTTVALCFVFLFGLYPSQADAARRNENHNTHYNDVYSNRNNSYYDPGYQNQAYNNNSYYDFGYQNGYNYYGYSVYPPFNNQNSNNSYSYYNDQNGYNYYSYLAYNPSSNYKSNYFTDYNQQGYNQYSYGTGYDPYVNSYNSYSNYGYNQMHYGW